MWILKDAQELIVALQPEAKKHGYHVALGGGVLNKGESQKDLDLYFLPLESAQFPVDNIALCMWLGSLFGSGVKIAPGMYMESALDPQTFGRPNRPVQNVANYQNDSEFGFGWAGRKKSKYTQKLMFMLGKKRIDAFII